MAKKIIIEKKKKKKREKKKKWKKYHHPDIQKALVSYLDHDLEQSIQFSSRDLYLSKMGLKYQRQREQLLAWLE